MSNNSNQSDFASKQETREYNERALAREKQIMQEKLQPITANGGLDAMHKEIWKNVYLSCDMKENYFLDNSYVNAKAILDAEETFVLGMEGFDRKIFLYLINKNKPEYNIPIDEEDEREITKYVNNVHQNMD